MTTQWTFIEHITDSLTRPRPGDPKQPTLWPSEASAIIEKNGKQVVVGKCRRATFFRFLLENFKFYDKYKMWSPLVSDIQCKALPTDRYLLWIWRQGELYEQFCVEQAKIAGIYSSGQIPVYIPQFNVSGKEDLEAVNPISHKLSVVEIKSVYAYGADAVIGSKSDKRNGVTGTPKDNNLMQIALYHWWRASEDTAYEESRLVYGSRDTGRYGEYLVKTVTQEDGTINILYKSLVPTAGPWVASPITINSILNEFSNIQLWLDAGTIPARDFDIVYNEEQLAECFANDEFTKAEREQYEKVLARRAENREKEVRGEKTKVELKQVNKGHWSCGFCNYKNVCYNNENQPREL